MCAQKISLVAVMGSLLGVAKWRRCGALLLFAIALSLLLNASWITVKAVVAQQLIAHAWQQSLVSTRATKPWAWADTWPVASLTTPAGDSLYVLAGASGEALAFGPGLLGSDNALTHTGTAIIAGHRDTHFAFMEQLSAGDVLQLQDMQSQQFSYGSHR
jgi:sortase A